MNENNSATREDVEQLSNRLNETKNCTVSINGHMLSVGRSDTMLRRAFEVLSAQNPDVDWEKNNLLLTIVPNNKVE